MNFWSDFLVQLCLHTIPVKLQFDKANKVGEIGRLQWGIMSDELVYYWNVCPLEIRCEEAQKHEDRVTLKKNEEKKQIERFSRIIMQLWNLK